MLHLSRDFNLKKWISNIILLTQSEVPLLSNALKNKNVEGETVTFYSTRQVARKGTVETDVNNTDTNVKVSTDLIGRLTSGYILQVGDELLKVVSVDKPNSQVEVVRGYAGTPATAITTGEEISILYKAEADGQVTEDFVKVQKLPSTNIIQEFTKSITLSSRAASLPKKDYQNLIQEERIAKIDEMALEINTGLYYGRKYLDRAGNGEGRHTMGGWKEAITNDGGVVFDAELNVTEEKFENQLVAIRTRGGKPKKIYLNSVTKAKVFKNFKNSVVINNNNQSDIKGGGIMRGYLSDALGYELLFEIDECVKNGDIFVGTVPLVDVMKDVVEGVDMYFAPYKEPTNSATYNETIKTLMTAEFQDAYTSIYITNTL